MKLAIAASFAITMIFSSAALAQYTVTVRPDPFWSSYYAAHGTGGADITDILAAQRNSEAMVNAYREAHGLPKCSIGLLGQWAGRPAC
jgi:hypothetical protein